MSPSRALPARLSGERALFVALLVLHLLPIWLLPFAPTQDGPAHLSLAQALRLFDRPAGALFHEYLLPNHEAIPNWFVYFLFTRGLGFLSLPMAEKVLLSAYVLLLPVSVRSALRAVRPGAEALAVFAFPFTYNFLLNMGFYNFCCSLAAFFFALAFWLRRRDRLGLAGTAGLALLELLVYFCHPVSFALLVGTVGTLASWSLLRERLRHGFAPRAVLDGFRRWLLGPLVASLPALVLLGSFVGRRLGARSTSLPWDVKVRQLAALYSLVSLDRRLVVVSILLALTLAALAVSAFRRRRLRSGLRRSDGLLLAALAVTGVYFVSPDTMSGGGFITHRLNLFPPLLLLLWIGSFVHPPKVRKAAVIVGVALSLALLGGVAVKWAELDGYLSEYMSAVRYLEPGHTLLALSFANAGEGPEGEIAFRTWPFVHAQGHLIARRPLMDLALYEANEDYFPLYYRPERNPYRTIALGVETPLEEQPPRVDFLTYGQRTGGSVDYVLLGWPRAAPPRDLAEAAIRSQLEAGYERIYRSRRGLVELYRRKAPSVRGAG